MSIKAFLEQVKPLAGRSQILRFVTGNQSADMDSVVSAIVYAFFYNKHYPDHQPYLPLVNIPRDELKLRRDIELLLNSHGITDNNLFFVDDIKTLSHGNSKKLELILVDHCNLQGQELLDLYKASRVNVTGIIDHHADEGVFLNADPRIIHSNGSCSSMVFNYWTQKQADLASNEVVRLLLGPLLIDTTNMTHKVEEEDEKAFAAYKKTLEGEVQAFDASNSPIDELFKSLKKAKKDLDGYSFYDILRKDYKQFAFTNPGGTVNVGFSSLSKSIKWITNKYTAAEITQTLEDISKNFGLDIVIITTSYTKKENDEYTREFVFSTQESKFHKLAKFADSLELNDDIYGGSAVTEVVGQVNEKRHLEAFNQVNIKASRKQVVPAVKDIIEGGKV
ncbi:hypothetical protein FT663_01795 [Candidozyma haemuli var. vulneris]|uniref:DHHA2 domain-containing protein n=1 Tax=Candidozyma haemuli TaxID=45357 RepID=A0A2V1AZ26_9ASCO|nr:hypothetical protein CXQ85_002866 [[Candida] haemuloni]KAF3991083.1 hypothetical protein FT662_01911 [[Candida] haemuloni var. vulneris]KAF3993627.1 hypothetical protein FT663_01795 [[Candida] haemuloni var. vulneris]PVH23138.1 hypothetical protein CXQ85_002866 [[Candida] haemuloni]